MAASIAGLIIAGACSAELDGPSPSAESVAPVLACNAQLDTLITLRGAELSPLALDAATGDPRLAVPDIDLRRVRDLSGAAVTDDSIRLPNDPDDPDSSQVSWENTTTMHFELTPELGLSPGYYEVTVTNRNGNSATLEANLTMVPEPTLATVEPDLFCTADGAVSLTLSGEGFLEVDGELPVVLLDDVEIQASAIDGCVALDTTSLATQSCTTLTVSVATGVVANGVHAVFVRNPEPAACTSDDEVSALITGAPVVDTIEPTALCSLDLPESVTVTGSGLLRIDNGAGGFDEPEVLIDDGTASFSLAVTAMDGCEPLAGTTLTAESCTSLTFEVPDTIATNSYDLTLINPGDASCALSTPIRFEITGPPTIDGVVPNPVCSAGDTITVTGTGFIETSEVLVGGVAVPTTFVSTTELMAAIEPGFTPGSYDVTVSNLGNCVSGSATDQLIVAGIPVVFFVDPPNNFSGIEVRLTVWVSGVNGGSPTVAVRPTGTTDVPTPLLNPVFNGTSQILVTLPAGLAAGDYDVLVDDNPCPAEIINALHITDTPTVHISEVTPGFGADDVSTAVIIRSDDPTPGGEVNFAATPRAYLTPQGGGEAAELRSVSFENLNKLTGVVPPGLTPGSYDLIVVNPDGQVGVFTDAFRVLPAADPPPDISGLLPSQVTDGASVSVSVLGSAFPANAADVEVTAECLDPSNVAGGLTTRTATVLGSAFSQVDTEWDLSGLAGFVCVVRVTNLANQTFTEFSALAVTNSSGNVNSFTSSTDMIEARRALGAAALRLNNQSRFIFAIGGDGGDDGVNPPTALASVESAPVDAFGDVGIFSLQRNSLPEPRSFPGVTSVGRYVYAAGGRVGAGAGTVTDSVLRAYLLDPDEAPELSDISLEQSAGGAGLPGGIFYYRVAAVMAVDDPNNPDGEGLPSQPFVVQLPDLTGGLDMTLFWDGVPGAASYRLYRSPTPGLALGSEVLLAEFAHVGAGTDLQSFVDDNSIDNSAATDIPLPLGSLGVWHAVGTLATAREGASVLAVPDPVNTDTHYLYAIGGRDAGGAVLDSYEYVAITDVASNDQPVAAAFTTGAETLNEARWLAGAVYLDQTRTPEVQPDTAWVYVLKGADADESAIAASRMSLFQVDTGNGGELINEHIINVGSGAGGYGTFAGNNSIFVFGGGGTPSSQVRSGLLAEDGCPADCFPDLSNLNAGVSMAVPRYLHASTAEGAFIYLLGGQTDLLQATASTERTNL
jgi:hypothetical protein